MKLNAKKIMKLKAIRPKIKQREAGEHLGITDKTISQIELLQVRFPKLAHEKRINDIKKEYKKRYNKIF